MDEAAERAPPEHEPPELVPPEGFVVMDRRGLFSTHNGPFYHRPNPTMIEHGFFVLDRHCNGLGLAHGGLLASFIDSMLGNAASSAAKSAAVTIHLSLDYLSMARAGEWVQGEARATRTTKAVVFVEARAFVGPRDVVRASGVFKTMDRHRLQR